MNRKIINPWAWQEQLGFVQAVKPAAAGRLLFCSGQVSVDDEGRPLHQGDMFDQIGQALDNLKVVLEKAGMEMADVVRLNYYVTDMAAFRSAEPFLKERLQRERCYPASTLLGVASLYHREIMVEIEATAVSD